MEDLHWQQLLTTVQHFYYTGLQKCAEFILQRCQQYIVHSFIVTREGNTSTKPQKTNKQQIANKSYDSTIPYIIQHTSRSLDFTRFKAKQMHNIWRLRDSQY